MQITMRDRLVREISHGKSIGEYDYAGDLQFIVDFIDGKLPAKVLETTQVKSAQDCADHVGINLKAFEA